MDDATATVPRKIQITDLRQEGMTEMLALMPEAVEALRRNLKCGNPEVEVGAAQVILTQVAMPQAAYSFVGHVSNQTNYTLTLKSYDAGGGWDEKPPTTIAPGASPRFSGHYDGFDYKGTVIYESNGGAFMMTWDIPLFGNNSISASSTIPGTVAGYEGGRGWHAQVWYYLKSA